MDKPTDMGLLHDAAVIFLRENTRASTVHCAKPHILKEKRGLPKKCHVREKNLLRSPAPIRKYPSPNGGGDADGRKRKGQRSGSDKKRRDDIGGRAEQDTAPRLILSLRSLTSLVSEEICGRFGSVDGSTLHIGSVGFGR